MSATVQLGTHTVPLQAPASMMLRREVGLAMKAPLRGLCAALGVCWRGKPLRAKYAYDALAYGGEVFDELLAIGIPEADIYAAGTRALEICLDVPTEEGTSRAEDFSDPPPGGSTR